MSLSSVGMLNITLHEVVARELRQQVHVAGDQRALGGDAHRVLASKQDLEQRARDLVGFLERLVWIGVRAERDGRALVVRRGKFFFEQRCGVGLVKKFRFEIEAGGEADVGVAGAGVAVNTAMLASPIRIDRLPEMNVGRVVAADDRSRGARAARRSRAC